MTPLQAALLGVVQGLTEFLPISSSAHLILARAWWGWDAGDFGLAFDVACHLGTLVSVLVFFRQDVVDMTLAAGHALRTDAPAAARVARSIVIGTLPIVVVGLLWADLITTHLRTPLVAAAALALGALVMVAAERVSARRRSETSLTALEALGLGVAQSVALVPGISRSGAVLTLGMLLGLQRDRAARFAFLLGIPAILAAGGKAALELAETGVPAGAGSLMLIGGVTSAVVGYLTVKYFIRYLASHSLDGFAVYRVVLAGLVVVAFAGR